MPERRSRVEVESRDLLALLSDELVDVVDELSDRVLGDGVVEGGSDTCEEGVRRKGRGSQLVRGGEERKGRREREGGERRGRDEPPIDLNEGKERKREGQRGFREW